MLKLAKGNLLLTNVLSLQLFENNKSPGEDGLTVEFYKTFWNIVGNLMVESLNYSYDHGELSSSQKCAIITLIEKTKGIYLIGVQRGARQADPLSSCLFIIVFEILSISI